MDIVVNSTAQSSVNIRHMRLATLTNTRWLAVVGQSVALAIVHGVLEFPVPILPCLVLIGSAALLNVVLTNSFPANQRLEPLGVLAVLTFDICQLSGLLYFTGGMENPFSVLMTVPVIISAATLPWRFTALLGLMVVLCASFLMFFHWPLPWFSQAGLDIPFVYVAGIWVAVISSLTFTAFYIYRVAEEARRLTDALAATELVLQREQHLSALDGLAAAAAHELGTPLATISLVAKEMDRAVDAPEIIKEDIALLRAQADRCREILGRISTLQTTTEKHISRLSFMSMIEDVVAPHREFGVSIQVDRGLCVGEEPVMKRNPGVLYGLGNFIENAVDFAESRVHIHVTWDEDIAMLIITDDGKGFAPEQIARLGEPDIGSHSGPNRKQKGSGGLGLGIFIAKTLLERSGAQIRFSNDDRGKSGARVTVQWGRGAFN